LVDEHDVAVIACVAEQRGRPGFGRDAETRAAGQNEDRIGSPSLRDAGPEHHDVQGKSPAGSSSSILEDTEGPAAHVTVRAFDTARGQVQRVYGRVLSLLTVRARTNNGTRSTIAAKERGGAGDGQHSKELHSACGEVAHAARPKADSTPRAGKA
jgi:hypothetical protein